MHQEAGTSDAVKAMPEGGKCPFGHGAGPAVVSLAETLKESTKEAHTRAEKHPIQGRLVTGQSSRQEYAAWLGQMFHVWSAVDVGLARLVQRDRRVGAMVKPYHAHAARVSADLAFLGDSAANHAPLAETARFVERVNRAAADVSLVGVWYVLEGSANGGRYIAKALSRGLGIAAVSYTHLTLPTNREV